ncbi:MAG TPA: hypothetical protein VKV80_03930 [Streptosporangiaceae bacterium]|nr:hypothetical protein [Streptosporangiaceae bacterium]
MADIRSPRRARECGKGRRSRGFRSPRVPGLLAVPILVAAAVAGCSSGGSATHATQAAKAGSAGSASVPDGTGNQGAYTASQLRAALLTSVSGQKAAAPVESGAYGSLAQVKAVKRPLKGLKISPATCARATLTGFNSPSFAGVPAAVVTFMVGRNGITDVLLAPPAATAAAALDKGVPAGCARYRATEGGKTYVYKITDEPVTGVADAARAIDISVSGPSTMDIWSVVYRAPKFMGAVIIDGPAASQDVAKTLAIQAYAHAAKVLG